MDLGVLDLPPKNGASFNVGLEILRIGYLQYDMYYMIELLDIAV